MVVQALGVYATEGLSRRLRAQPDVLLGLLFGSVAEGRAGPESDVDVAVWTKHPLASERRRELTQMLALATGRPVDLVDLRTAGPMILRSALGGKRLVYREPSLYAALLSQSLIDAADFLRYRERILQQRRDAWIS